MLVGVLELGERVTVGVGNTERRSSKYATTRDSVEAMVLESSC